MSMYCTLVMASDACLDYLKRHPHEVRPYIWGPRAAYTPGWFARLLGAEAVPADRPLPPVCTRSAGDEFGTYDWHCLQFIMTGKDWDYASHDPLDFFVADWIPIGSESEDIGAFRSELVAELACALAAITADTLSARYDQPQMRALGIYAVDERPRAEALADLLTEFARFHDFIRKTADLRHGLLKHIG